MKLPVNPIDFTSTTEKLLEANKDDILSYMQKITCVDSTDARKRYLHWDKLRYLAPPDGYSHEEWWVGTKLARKNMAEELPLISKTEKPFWFCVPKILQKELHWLDMNAAGTMSANTPDIASLSTQKIYLLSSLIQEAISSSQLEGASTTREVAREMLRQKRKPMDKSEQMIFNNYLAMEFIRENKDEDITPEMIFALHEILTKDTLDNPARAGALRTDNERIYVAGDHDQILHVPPKAKTLKTRLKRLCAFANKDADNGFIHPVLKAIIIHFVLAYDHPFVDGNGRTARALFYWFMAKKGYWLVEFLSISRVIQTAPKKYSMAFLYTETDDNDLTYFLFHQVEVIKQAIRGLRKYLEKKTSQINQAGRLLENSPRLKNQLNFRQLSVLRHALKHPGFTYRIVDHQNTHGIVYETARKDLMKMSDTLSLLDKVKHGKTYVFLSPYNLEQRITTHGRHRRK